MTSPWIEHALTVSELTHKVKATLEPSFELVHVKGEVSGARFAGNGHLYFTLRDSGATLPCVIWRTTLSRLKVRFDEGLELALGGSLQIWAPSGRYQLVIKYAAEAGLGEALLKLEALKQALSDEGLFSPERKRPLPLLPRRIGLVTSPTGAALHDFLVTSRRRGKANILLAPCLVQGERAPDSISAALDAIGQIPHVDVVVLTRGGGSAMDLLAFSDEKVVRAIARCPVPVVSAVGHEVDFSLADLVADERAATPTAAAERVTPRTYEIVAALRQRDLRHQALTERKVAEARQALDARLYRLEQLANRLANTRKRQLEHAQLRLQQAHPMARLVALKAALQQRQHRLNQHTPHTQLSQGQHHLSQLKERLSSLSSTLVSEPANQLHLRQERLRLLSPLASLDRGWALVRKDNGELVHSTHNLQMGDALVIRLSDGLVTVRVEAIAPLVKDTTP